MAENKKGFVLYADIIHTVNQLPDEDAGKLFKHILSYVNDLKPESDSLVLNIAFEPIKQQLKRDLEKYEAIVERNRANGKKGGAPKKPKEPRKPTRLKSEPRKADKDNGTDTDTGIDTEKDISIFREKLQNELINSTSWIVSVVRNMNAIKLNTDLTETAKAIILFCNKLEAEDDIYKSIREAKSHFSRWYKIELEKGTTTNIKKSRNEQNLDHNTQTAKELGLDQ